MSQGRAAAGPCMLILLAHGLAVAAAIMRMLTNRRVRPIWKHTRCL